LPWTPLFYLVVFLIHPVLGWCGIAGGLVLALIAALSELATRRPAKDAGPARLRAAGEADAAVRNADARAAMGLLPGFLRRWERLNEQAIAPQMRAGQRGAALSALAKAARLALQSIVLGVGAYLAIRGELSGGAMIAASIVIARAVAPLEQAIGSWRSLIAARSAWGRLRTLFQGEAGRVGRIALPRPKGAVRVERATYAAGNLNEPILRAVSFALDPGDSLAILGPSGAGKSTLLRLLVGSLRPQAGALRLDGAAMGDWTDADKASYIGYLPQDVELFNASVRDNIARFTDAGDDEVVAAAKLAGAHETILRLPQGYATILGPGGVLLSGGQRQRIGLARALFGDPRLVVLDEPNAHLDAEGEQALEEALRALKERQATVVLVAQRLAVVAQVDKVLMLREGRVESFGPRQPLGRRPEAAQEMARGRLVRLPAARSVGGDD
ncbi:MAG: ATP-binding cassette domain-containing protein, partial [Rhodospirillales bacterium]|nr:ATP-binding cassette domain-containing protein [Rhodospirillales bacterium]